MTPPADYERVRSLFLDLLDLPANQRADALARSTADPDTRSEVARLLDHHDSGDQLAEIVRFRARDAPTRTPTTIGPYLIEEQLGQGGFGSVYRGRHRDTGRYAAVKVLHAPLMSRESEGRFFREAQLLKQFQHPGIVQLIEVGLWQTPSGDDRPFLAMELIEGLPLLEYTSTHCASTSLRLGLFREMCDIVDYAHSQGVIHRDLKPGNILVDAQGRPHLVDFGLSRIDGTSLELSEATQPGQILGTLAYMSPEQALGDPSEVDARSDVYSLAVIGYRMLADRLPYDLPSGNLREVLGVLTDPPIAPLGRANPTLAGAMEAVFGRALARDKGDRYATAGAFARDVLRAEADATAYVTALSPARRLRRSAREHPRFAALIAILITLLVGAGVLAGRSLWNGAQRGEASARWTQSLQAVESAEELFFSAPRTPKYLARSISLYEDAVASLELLPESPEIRAVHRLVEIRLGDCYSLLSQHSYNTEELRLARLHHGAAVELELAKPADPELIPNERVANAVQNQRGWHALLHLSGSTYALAHRSSPAPLLREAERLYQETLAAYAMEVQADPEIPVTELPSQDIVYCFALNELGLTMIDLGYAIEDIVRVDEGRRHVKRAAEIIPRNSGAEPAHASMLHNLGVGYLRGAQLAGSNGYLDSAERRLVESLAVRNETERPGPNVETRRALAEVLATRSALAGESMPPLEQARDLLAPALEILDPTEDAYRLAEIHTELAGILIRLGDLDNAEAHLDAASATLTRARTPLPYLWVEVHRGRLAEARYAGSEDPSQLSAARQHYATALGVLQPIQHPRWYEQIREMATRAEH